MLRLAIAALFGLASAASAHADAIGCMGSPKKTGAWDYEYTNSCEAVINYVLMVMSPPPDKKREYEKGVISRRGFTSTSSYWNTAPTVVWACAQGFDQGCSSRSAQEMVDQLNAGGSPSNSLAGSAWRGNYSIEDEDTRRNYVLTLTFTTDTSAAAEIDMQQQSKPGFHNNGCDESSTQAHQVVEEVFNVEQLSKSATIKVSGRQPGTLKSYSPHCGPAPTITTPDQFTLHLQGNVLTVVSGTLPNSTAFQRVK